LETLAKQGYDWIYWGDDDDPPLFNDEFEHSLGIAKDDKNIGAIGSVGSRFDFEKARIQRYKDEELKGVLDVDSIGGGQNIIASGKAIRAKGEAVLPTGELFFAFEDLDFVLKMKKENYRVVVSGESALKHRKNAGNMNIKSKRKVGRKIDKNNLWRQYYSFRSLIYIFKYNQNSEKVARKFATRAYLKAVFGFIHGWGYGVKNAEYLIAAVKDARSKNLKNRVEK
jgi:hypothetical protein